MVVDWYNSMWEFRDKRVDDWFLLSSLWPTFLLCMAYVFMVKIFGPAYMNQKEPMSLKGFMMAYNIVQVSACLYMIKQIWVGGWGTYYSYLCQPLDSDPHPDSKAMIMASAMYWFYMSKLLDFVDTILFVLRKKNNQITTLHVFHHAIMPLYTWLIVQWIPGGQETFGALLNSFIHVLMYSYYFLSSLGDWIQPFLWWKRCLTQAQMVQFVIIFSKTLIIVSGAAECGFPWQISGTTGILMIVFFYLFYDFYTSAYKKMRANKKATKNGALKAE
uniref:Elongation of very long chain fatty acids protein n=1 Tax=Caligus clemensi TaxID=344056 RepID=C1C1Y8_CALCM|nr:Elongation of very long chain fatty acids protein AAEL008004 [Caligus clemensi]